jgi:hypothetical protein
MRFYKLLAAILVVAAVSTTALAVVVKTEWTPEFVKQNPGAFSVTSEMRSDGLVHFKVIQTHKLAGARWVVASLVVRKGDTRVAESHFPAVVREESVTYYFAISPDYMADSAFELSENGLGEVAGDAGRHPLPMPGGAINVFHLKDFAPKSPAKQAASPAK